MNEQRTYLPKVDGTEREKERTGDGRSGNDDVEEELQQQLATFLRRFARKKVTTSAAAEAREEEQEDGEMGCGGVRDVDVDCLFAHGRERKRGRRPYYRPAAKRQRLMI